MRRFSVILLMSALPMITSGQHKAKPRAIDPGRPVMIDWTKEPEFSGGEQAMNVYINKNLRYPEMAKEAEIEGRVIVQFVVMEDGSLANIKVIRGVGGGCDEEAVRVMKSMPLWKPALHNGKPTRAVYQQQVQFVLE